MLVFSKSRFPFGKPNCENQGGSEHQMMPCSLAGAERLKEIISERVALYWTSII
jgi:hypothetical protein